MIKLLIGGSPCTKWSIARKKDREVTAEGEGWELFLNYAIAKEKFKPDFFFQIKNTALYTQILRGGIVIANATAMQGTTTPQ